METTIKKQYNGLDLLKLIMAFMVVAIHTKATLDSPVVSVVLGQLIRESLAIFFVISGFLFFRNVVNNDGVEFDRLLHFLKRLAYLYLFWFVVWLPVIIKEKHLLNMKLWDACLVVVHDVLFSSTFHGAWFVSSLMWAITICFVLHKLRLRFLIVLLAVFSYFFVSYMLIPEVCYDWYTKMIRPEIRNSIAFATIWVPFGYFLSFRKIEDWYSKIPLSIPLCLYLVLYLLHSFGYIDVFRPVTVPLLFVVFHNVQLNDKPIYKKMRKLSTSIFFIHFFVFGSLKRIIHIPDMQNGPLLFVSTCVISLIMALFIIWLSEKKYCKWLRYSY